MERLVNGDAQAAAQAYRKMLELDPRAASLARMGLGDIALLQGDHEQAITELNEGLAADRKAGNKRAQADKLVAIAQAKLASGDTGAATAAITQALSLSSALAHIVPAAKMYIAMGDIAAASELQRQLEGKLQAEFRAAASLIKGNILLAQGDTVGAVDALRSSREMLDSWLIHFDLGRAYYSAGYYAEALSEFELCTSRIGEATSIYLDDNPSFRYSAQLKEWLAKTRAELGIQVTDPAQAG
jgi:tetratricopeptide (TPR) repeat protein